MFAKRLFSVKQPKAYYQSQPYLNYLDANEKEFLGQKYVTREPLGLTPTVDRYDTHVQDEGSSD